MVGCGVRCSDYIRSIPTQYLCFVYGNSLEFIDGNNNNRFLEVEFGKKGESIGSVFMVFDTIY